MQTLVLGILMRSIGNKNSILLGLGFQILQLAWYGFGSQHWSVSPAITILTQIIDLSEGGVYVCVSVSVDFLYFFFGHIQALLPVVIL